MRHFIDFYQQMPMSVLFLGLGTNLGDRQQNLQRAVNALTAGMRITAVSPIFETPPWGPTDQPTFYNCCLAAETDLTPQQLLSFIKEIENELGRIPTYRWGPRLIDIDLLFYDDIILEEDNLTVPHLRIAERAFVLAPLAAIAPDFIHPQTGQSMQALLADVDLHGVRPLPDKQLTIPVNS